MANKNNIIFQSLSINCQSHKWMTLQFVILSIRLSHIKWWSSSFVEFCKIYIFYLSSTNNNVNQHFIRLHYEITTQNKVGFISKNSSSSSRLIMSFCSQKNDVATKMFKREREREQEWSIWWNQIFFRFASSLHHQLQK